ncbi:MAG: hypothetical protein E6429_13050, partial [Staphylococcus sp.]|nr:hypothetical protein [Staphylococcus sp.]
HTTIIDRLDETTAARKPILKFEELKDEKYKEHTNIDSEDN